MNKTRFESFSDGVFAFAITLLVLAFSVPMNGADKYVTDAALTAALLKMGPSLVAYLLSFGVIGIMWQNHHALFRAVASIDRRTVFYNLLLLGSTVLIPFATSMLGVYPTQHASTFFYGVVLTLCSTCYNVMLSHLVKSEAFAGSLPPQRVTATVRAYRVGWATYAAAMLVALISPLVSFAMYVLIAVYYLIPRGIDDDIGGAAAGEP